ncbi:MAG: hypothetical protein MJD61_16770 [Proteobacteria bacterium]|nr:hypothetical protein [Pseudomonadota bacterium]
MPDADEPSDSPTREEVGELLALLVHDLRNPTATISANLNFVRDVWNPGEGRDGEDLRAALNDAGLALREVERGLEQCGWIANWILGQAPVAASQGNPIAAIEAAIEHRGDLQVELQIDQPPVAVVGGGKNPTLRQPGAVERLMDVLLANCGHWSGTDPIIVRVDRDPDGYVIVELCDTGHPVAPSLRSSAFSLRTQPQLKRRSGGRYGRALGLFAARVLADAIGARLEADERDARCLFRLRLRPVEP